MLVFTSIIAILAGRIIDLPKWLRWTRTIVPPRRVSDSGWFQILNDEALDANGAKRRVFVGLDMHDKTYVSGILDYFSTDPKETQDRDLVLAPPIEITWPDEAPFASKFSRLIVSARDIARMHVSYLPPDWSDTTDMADPPTP